MNTMLFLRAKSLILFLGLLSVIAFIFTELLGRVMDTITAFCRTLVWHPQSHTEF